MSLNSTPNADRVQIGLFGRQNAGKSSLINALTGQKLAIVSSVAGTTTDPVQKAMELLPLGPVTFIDTAGLDDISELGRERIAKSLQTLEKIDIALLVMDGGAPLSEIERGLIDQFQQRRIAYLIVRNKLDLHAAPPEAAADEMWVSAESGENIHALRERIAHLAPLTEPPTPIIADLLCPGDRVVLVVPVDSAAPKGRLILPQQQTIREILDADAVALVCKENAVAETLAGIKGRPRLVVTDSQAFAQVDAQTPPEVPLTSFSILFARHNGVLKQAVAGAAALRQLRDGDSVLISEGCTHHRQCDDIGTVKLPKWLREHTGKQLDYVFSSGNEFPEDLSPYRLVIHCGGCMLPRRSMQHRLAAAERQGVAMTNYGVLIAAMKGILARSLQPLPRAEEAASPARQSMFC